MKKVLVFSHEFPPALGGAGSVAKRNIIALVESGFETSVLTQTGADDIEGVEFFRVKVFSRLWFLSYFTFLLFRKHWLRSFDLILLNDPAAIYIAGLCMPKGVRSKSLVFMHGSEMETVFVLQSLVKRLQFFRYFFRKSVTTCKKVIFPSEWLRDKFINHPCASGLFGSSEVVYAGINQDLFYEVESDVRQGLSISEEDSLVLSVSRVIAMKGYPEMYQLFKRLHESKKGFHWLIIGDGDYLDELRRLVKGDRLEKYVHLVGVIPQYELKKYYSAADVFLLLSKFEEAYGLVYLEASAAGTPSIAFRKGGVCEAIVEGTTGFVVDSIEECFSLLEGKAWKTLEPEKMKDFVDLICHDGLIGLEEFGFQK